MKNKKKTLKLERNDSGIYILLLSSLSIFVTATRRYKFNLYGNLISYSIIFIPLIFFLQNYISKKYGYKKAILSIIISNIVLASFHIIISFAFTKVLNMTQIMGDVTSFFVSEMINLTIYQFLLNNTKSPYFIVLLTYMFSITLYYLVNIMVGLNTLVEDGYWMRYFMTLIIDFIMTLPISDIDTKIKRGQ